MKASELIEDKEKFKEGIKNLELLLEKAYVLAQDDDDYRVYNSLRYVFNNIKHLADDPIGERSDWYGESLD